MMWYDKPLCLQDVVALSPYEMLAVAFLQDKLTEALDASEQKDENNAVS